MGEIQILPELLVNKIAAGEVVERPASVVKELIENSIDAGADQIFVTLKNGGKDSITILDNGKGMSMEDASLAIERHATSKIKKIEDLNKIYTMGFRGEALAAIASVSHFELTTCASENEGGTQIHVEGGKIIQIGKTGFPKGTKIVVDQLFYNTPARQKFMKAIQTEYHHIYETLIRLAMTNPNIQFRLTHNQNVAFNFPKGQTFQERVHQCFGSEIADDLMEFEYKEGYLSFHGLFSIPSASRPSKRWQHLFVNQRYVKCKTIHHAIYQGYKTILMKNMHPMFFLKVTLSPEEIDVNVHPAKTEIRLKNQNLIHTILSEQVGKKLKQGTRETFFQDTSINDISKKDLEDKQSLIGKSENKQFVIEKNDQIGFGNIVDANKSQIPSLAVNTTSSSAIIDQNDATVVSEKKEFKQEFGSVETVLVNSKQQGNKESTFDEVSVVSKNEALKQNALIEITKQKYHIIGQFKKYILAIFKDQLVVIDKHAAHERIRFEEIRTQFYSKKLTTQALMIPLLLKLSPQDGLLLEQHQESFKKLGFVIDYFGGNDYSIKEVPSILKDKDIKTIITEVLDELATFGKVGKMEIFFNEVFETMACHSAIRGEQSMSIEEMQALCDQLQNLDLHIHCPHGRPVMVDMSIQELDKRFKRIV